MPSKPAFWSKSNRSQASVGSATDYASSVSSEHRYRAHDEHQQRARQSSTPSLDHPPVKEHEAAPAPVDRPPEQPHVPHTPQPQENVSQGQEQRRSLRSRLGLGHSSKESVELVGNKGGLGRRVSVRKKDVPGAKPPSSSDEQRYHWSSRQSSTHYLPPSQEADEDSHLDPFLQPESQPHSPAPPAQQDGYYSQGVAQAPDPTRYRRPSLARVDTEQSYRGRPSGEYHYSPHPQQGNIGLTADQQPPPYQPYAQPPPPQVQTYQDQHYQAFHPHLADSPHSQSQPAHEYLRQQQQGPHGRPGSRQQQEQDLQFIPAERPPPQQQYPPQELHRPQVNRVLVQQQQQQQRPAHEQQQAPQQQYIPSSPAVQQNQGLVPQTQQEFVITPVQEIPPQQASSQMPPSAPSKRTAEAPKQGGPPREGSSISQQGGQTRETFGAGVVPPASQGQPFRGGNRQGNGQDSETGRATPPPQRAVSDMSDEEVLQLVKDHDVLREKYQKVKRYFFEQQSQVHQLQNTLAHQRLSQSRTSLDDSEYSSRFNRLDGLVSQLAFTIRKDWKSIPPLLQTSVNRDAVQIGKQEMTAVGRAFISAWLVDEVFNKYFHPDLDKNLSMQLKTIQLNIRRGAPLAQNSEEEEALTSKIVNWRLATTEGLADQLRGQQATANREHLITTLNEALIGTLEMYISEPAPPDLAGGVPMIIELVVNILAHLPLESREVCIEYFPPGHGIVSEQMRVESGGIPALNVPCAEGLLQQLGRDDAAERASVASTTSDLKDAADRDPEADSPQQQQQQQQQAAQRDREEPKRSGGRGMLAGLMGGSNKKQQQQRGEQQLGTKLAGGDNGGGSQVSLSQPKEEQPPRVRIAAGVSVRILGRSVLVKAPVFPTA